MISKLAKLRIVSQALIVSLTLALTPPIGAQTQDISLDLQNRENALELNRLMSTVIDDRNLTVQGQTRLLRGQPDRLIDFVQSEITVDLYEGILRGGEGTLLTRSGNSIDQSLLLAEMLQVSGFEVQIGHRMLQSSEVERLLNRFQNQTPTRLSLVPDEETLGSLQVLLGLDRSEVEQRVREAVTEANAASTAFTNRWTEASQVLRSSLGEAFNTAIPSPDLAAEREHHWVLFKGRGISDWEVVDPVGLFNEQNTGDLAVLDLEDLPEALFHQVELEFKLALDGQQEPLVIARAAFRAADQTVTPIRVSVLGWSTQQNAGFGGDPSDVFVAEIVSDQAQSSEVQFFQIDGELVDGPPNPNALDAPLSTGLGGLAGALDGLIPADEGPAPTATSAELENRLQAAWLDMVVLSPGEPEETFRRDLPTTRDEMSGHLLLPEFWTYDVALRPGALPPEYVQFQAAQRELFVWASAPGSNDERPQNAVIPAQSVFFASILANSLREYFHNASNGTLLHLDGLGLVAVENELFGTSDSVTFRNTLDIIRLPERALTFEDNELRADAVDQFNIGVAATALENDLGEIFAQSVPSEPLSDPMARNALVALEYALQNNGQVIAAVGDQTVAVEETLSELGRQTVAQQNPGRQQILLVPTMPEQSSRSWWQYDPVTGDIIGVNQFGRGQETTEYSLLNTIVVTGELITYACFALGLFAAIPNNTIDRIITGVCAISTVFTVQFAGISAFFPQFLARGADGLFLTLLTFEVIFGSLSYVLNSAPNNPR